MNENQLYEIIRDHPEACPKGLVWNRKADGEWECRGRQIEHMHDTVLLLLEASFHRSLLTRGDVYATPTTDGGYRVQINDCEYEATTLIEAYAKAWIGVGVQ